MKKEKLHEFEIKMDIAVKVMSVLFSISFLFLGFVFESDIFKMLGLFWSAPLIVYMLLTVFKDEKILKKYLEKRCMKKKSFKSDIIQLIIIITMCTMVTLVSFTWYIGVLVVILGFIYEYESNYVKVKKIENETQKIN